MGRLNLLGGQINLLAHPVNLLFTFLVLDNTKPCLCSSTVCFWMPPAHSKEHKYHIFGNTGTREMFQYSSILGCSGIFLLKEIRVIIGTQSATEGHNQLCCDTAVDISAILFVSLHGTWLRRLSSWETHRLQVRLPLK